MRINLTKKHNFSTKLLTLFAVFLLSFSSINAQASSSSEEGGKFNASEMILHHIMDSHEWHFATIGHTHITLPLPIIIYSSERGLDIFSSSHFHSEGFVHEGYHENHPYHHFKIDDKTSKIVPIDEERNIIEDRTIYDLSITKNVASMMLSAVILIFVFLTAAKGYVTNHGKAPKGVQSFVEPLIVFVRDEIAIPNIGAKNYMKFMPYLLTVFFFIWINNLLGLMPSGANLTGNIAFTMTLAVCTAVITNFSANKSYWAHIFKTPGVPTWLLPIMIPVELIGILTKPFALMIRLFANITAGHIIILSIISFIFIFKSAFVGAVSVPFAVAMSLLEVFVAAVQAFIFTLLSALFIGMANEEHEHSHEEGHAHH